MRSISAAALLVLATLSECLGAQSDRSRSRSSVRSVPVASNTKRDINFDCPEEFGYYPHPTDCTLYYVCVFGGALLESCTGGLMYSHELQTCDWPRNVGCDGTSAIGGDELERLSDRDPPPPPPPPRRAPPPPPRAQPNPVITSRGQPKFNRQEYEKQQQLYAEVDDLPPIEELESDRQQRVYRGQPPTIGQVQKDRDGYAAQQLNSGRTLNSNIIPASLSQNSKIGSFSFGSQVDERRTATVTPAPQSYNDDNIDIATDSLLHDRQLDIETNKIDTDDVIEKYSRVKRDVVENNLVSNKTVPSNDTISNKNDSGEEMEYVENEEGESDGDTQDDSERGKRQVRYYLKNGYKTNGKSWTLAKPVKIVDLRRPITNNNRPQQISNNYNRNNYYETSARPNDYYTTANPFLSYQTENAPSQSPFKPSFPDPSNQQLTYHQLSSPTHIITKSPPISSMSNNEFSSLAGGFYNNAANNNRFVNQPSLNIAVNRPVNQISFLDSSQLPSSVVTGKPVKIQSNRNEQQQNVEDNRNGQRPPKLTKPKNTKRLPNKSKDYEEEESNYSDETSSEESEEASDDDFRPEYPNPPYNYKFPNNKYKDIVNPFANPDFDFDSYLYKISGGDYPNSDNDEDYSDENTKNVRKPVPIISSTIKPAITTQPSLPSSTVNYDGMSTPNPFKYTSGSVSTIGPLVSSVSPQNNIQYERLNVGFVSTILPSLNNNGHHVQQNTKYNVNSAHQNQFLSVTTAQPLSSSIRPSHAPLHQSPQFETIFLGSSSTISPDHSLRSMGQLDASRELVATSASIQNSQRPSFAPYKQRPGNEPTFESGSTRLPNKSNEMPSFNPIKHNSQYEQFLSLSPNVALSTGSSTRPTMIETKHNEHYKQFISSTIRPNPQNSQGSLNPTQSYNQFRHSLQQPGSSKVPEVLIRPSIATIKQMEYEKSIHPTRQSVYQPKNGQINNPRPTQQTASVSYDSVRPKIKPPNFNDDRQLPISYSFLQPTASSAKPNTNGNLQIQQVISVTGKPYNIFVTGTSSPLIVSSPKQQKLNIISDPPYLVSTGKPYSISSAKPYNEYAIVQQTTQKPLTTLANEQLAALRHFWNSNPTQLPLSPTLKPAVPSNIPNLENLFAHIIQSTQVSYKNDSDFVNIGNILKSPSTTKAPPKRRPIPKPSPEMNDYYYDDEDEYYNEPAVKPKYMPSTEVKPQRPVMAQNYKEYDESYEYDDDENDHSVNIRPSQATRLPVGFSTRKPESITKNHNDVSIITKSPLKNPYKNDREKIPVPVLVDYISSTPSSILQPEPSAFKLIPHDARNKTYQIRKPVTEGPNTQRPPKYLNQTTLRPYTVRHRLAKPTTVNEPEEDKQTRGKVRHHNIVAQMISTTPRDSFNQETRYTKTKHDDTSNSLEPTESVSPSSYSASPRPKLLYNGTQNYSPDQYDPFYAVYDEDGELYKDADYVQQYNTASVRPAVQQTYRGTPPPVRRPVETYTPRPLPEDYDDELIQGQISNQNQYQTPIRHSTRGEGNELGYDHNPSTVKTSFYEVTTKSTTPPTTSTSTTTTTKRPTTAPYTEAMTPPRNTPRSPTDENPNPDSSSIKPDESISSIPSTSLPRINLSALAKPFEKTDNSHRLEETILPTKRQKISRRPSQVNNNSVEVVRSKSIRNDKKVLSLTSGFSIRRNLNNTNNPYTLTVRTHPYDDYNKSRGSQRQEVSNRRIQSGSNIYGSSSSESSVEPVEFDSHGERSSERPTRRKDFISVVEDDYDIPVYVRPTSKTKISETKPATLTTTTTVKPIIEPINLNILTDRSLPLITTKQDVIDSTENSINKPINNINSFTRNERINVEQDISPVISPYKSLDNLRNTYRIEDTFDDHTFGTSSPTQQYKTSTRKPIRIRNPNKGSRSNPSYYSYKLEEDDVPDKTTEVFSGKVKTVIQTFLNNFESSTFPEIIEEIPVTTTTIKSTTPIQKTKDEVVNIGYQRKINKYSKENPMRTNVQRLKIITEPSISQEIIPSIENINLNDQPDLTSMTTTMVSSPFIYASFPTTPMSLPSSTNDFDSGTLLKSKFIDLITTKPISEISQKFKKNLSSVSDPQGSHLNNEPTNPIEINKTDFSISTVTEASPLSKLENDVASTTSTTKATTTVKFEPTSTTTKSISFPTRASRVNPAIKLAATNPGSGRRSYQSSSKCSSDNSLQANPKCNEIKYQRPTSTRGRGSAHYSKSSTSDAQQSQAAPNRGTPPTRSRPTLKPSTAIVSETAAKFVDIYSHPPSRPAPVYPQPTPDKTAAKCRKDVCLLPDCYCGGKDIPGELPVEQVPQIVILTFDDSVNDLNKGLYTDLFEKGRVNPNGCPITATFYVSHEWTDYSQVQNLYAVGHEMASHTVSHSFGEQFSQKKWNREVGGQREILAAYGGVKLEDVRGMRAPFLSVGGNNMFKMLYESNFTYDSSLPVYENKPPSWPYTLDYKIFHDCMIPPCPTKSYPGVWEVPMVMWQDLNGGRCSMGDACANPPEPENVYKMILKNFDRHYTSNRAPFGLFYHAAWFTQPHHKEGFIMFLDFINKLPDVWIVTNWQALQWVRDPTPISRLNNFQPFQCDYQDRPKKCNNPKVCNLWHKSGVRYMRTCQPCPEIYPWTGKSGIRSSRIDNNGE